MSFFQKYKPESLKDIQGNQETFFKLRKAVSEKKPVLLYGPPGIGKTISVHVLASELNFELIEVNASDTRNKDSIHSIVGAAASQMSLFSKGKIILIDEIDGLSGKEDRGGVQEVASILSEVKQPVVVIANDPWDSKFSTLRKKCMLLELKSLSSFEILRFLEKISKQENIKINPEELNALAVFSKGDLRAAINDLETLSSIKKEITKQDIDNLGFRERKESILIALKKIFKS
ncbi:MAG TPA: AAA family ATPase, partial [Candidatus Nanoarchaeia archaeon]|nr:AAA family ATPase [Candidatus Nanoarchaeia archaeon]